MEEYFDLRDEAGRVTGQVKARTLVHRDGDLHGTAHVWLARSGDAGPELLLQLRSRDKDAYPGCWDISSAGHLPAGSEFLESALRELSEELGLAAAPGDLRFLGFLRRCFRGKFHGAPFADHELAAVYLLRRDVRPDSLRLQREEVEAVRWFPLAEICARLSDPDFPNCLIHEELDLVSAALGSADERRIP